MRVTVAASVPKWAIPRSRAFRASLMAKDIYHQAVDQEDMRRKLGDAAGVITVSGYNQRYLQATYGQAAEQVRRIYNGLHLDRFT